MLLQNLHCLMILHLMIEGLLLSFRVQIRLDSIVSCPDRNRPRTLWSSNVTFSNTLCMMSFLIPYSIILFFYLIATVLLFFYLIATLSLLLIASTCNLTVIHSYRLMNWNLAAIKNYNYYSSQGWALSKIHCIQVQEVNIYTLYQDPDHVDF